MNDPIIEIAQHDMYKMSSCNCKFFVSFMYESKCNQVVSWYICLYGSVCVNPSIFKPQKFLSFCHVKVAVCSFTEYYH